MGIGMIDKTGQPRSDDELREAISVVEKVMVSIDCFKNPTLFVQLPTIREALKELLDIRKQIELLKR